MKNWIPRLTGLLSLGIIGLKIAHDPTSAFDSVTLSAIATGVGVVFAKQHNVTGGTVPQAGGTEPADVVERKAALQK